MNLVKNSGGVLAVKVSNFVGIFDYLKQHHNIKAGEVVKLMDDFPELALQNKNKLMMKKFDLIRQNRQSLTPIYLRNLFKRHPDLFLMSYASMVAKVFFIKSSMNRQLQ